MSDELKTKLILFTDTHPERIEAYKTLAFGSYNYFEVPPSLDEEIETGLNETRKLALKAQEKGTPVALILKENLKDLPITYALVNERDGKILAAGCIKNHEYLLRRAKQANQLELVKEIESAPTSWGCLEYICVDEKYRGRHLGIKTLEALCSEAEKMGLENQGLYCAKSEIPFYEKAGMTLACLVDIGGVIRSEHGGNLYDQKQRHKIVSDGITLGQIIDFIDAHETTGLMIKRKRPCC